MLANEVAQSLVQGYVAHSLDPTRNSYEAFVLRMSDNMLQLQETAMSSTYLQELCRGKSSAKKLQVSCSDTYDLRECDQRREALRLILGLFSFLAFCKM